jgi:hypothetical protein
MIGVGLMSVLPWGMLLSQSAASYLVGVRAKK